MRRGVTCQREKLIVAVCGLAAIACEEATVEEAEEAVAAEGVAAAVLLQAARAVAPMARAAMLRKARRGTKGAALELVRVHSSGGVGSADRGMGPARVPAVAALMLD
ncbi:MAG: hypothetical protein M1296_04845 [Chloroflexi bacterium]|nr:hypothetical protein [Chloroflexota bacterium]